LLAGWFSEFLKVQTVTVRCSGYMHSIFGECICAIKYRSFCDPYRKLGSNVVSPYSSLASIDRHTLQKLVLVDNSVQDVHTSLLRSHWLSLQELYFYAPTPVDVKYMHEHEFILVLSRQCTQLKKLYLPNMIIPFEVLMIWLQQQLDFDVQLYLRNKQQRLEQQKKQKQKQDHKKNDISNSIPLIPFHEKKDGDGDGDGDEDGDEHNDKKKTK